MRIGIDLGGTKIDGVCMTDDGRVIAHGRVATPQDGYQAVLAGIAALVERLEREAGSADRSTPIATPIATQIAPPIAAPNTTNVTPGTEAGGATIGVAAPGFLAPADGLLRNSNLMSLNDHAIDRDLAVLLGRPVRVANDANCFVLSETTDGAATRSPGEAGASADVVFGATLGTGIGGGFVVDGRVWGGVNGSAGEWSHTTLPFLRAEDGPGGGCTCGRDACIESFLSGHGLEWDHRRTTGETVSPVEIGERARAGDPRATATFERYEDRLARALAGVINLIDPRAIVLGGGISNNVRLFERVPAIWERYTVAKQLSTRLVRARHGDASGVRGAAWLWPPGDRGRLNPSPTSAATPGAGSGRSEPNRE